MAEKEQGMNRRAVKRLVLQQLADVVVEFLNGHPFSARAMELREEMSRLCQAAGLLPPTPEDPPEPGAGGAEG